VKTLLCIGLAAALVAGFASISASGDELSTLPSDTPAQFKPVTESFDYIKREEMIPMRDGVKLKTFILVPKSARNAPMLLSRTPYDAAEYIARFHSPRLTSVVPAMLETAAAAGYIIVVQDVRGKHGSEGDYVMSRPLKGPLNPTDVDHSTDTYDTIDWLVKNVQQSNGRVGTPTEGRN
jgi:predicted acyl esterase